MTIDGNTEMKRSQELLRRLDIVIGLLAVVVALQVVLVAHLLSGSFVPAFLLTVLFGLGVTAVARSLLE